MKFSLIAIIVLLLAAHLCASRNKCKVKEVKAKLTRDMDLEEKIPGVNTLYETVKKLSTIKDSVQPIFDEMTKLINDGLNNPDMADKINNTYIEINPVGAKDTKVGDFIQLISDQLDKGMQGATKLIANVNQTMADLTKAGENFVDGLLRNSKKNSSCSTAMSQAGTRFTNAFIENAKSCVENVLNVISRHTENIDIIQLELNSGIQTGKVPVELFKDILVEATTIKSDISSNIKNFAECEMKGLVKSLGAFSKYYASASLKCVTSMFGK